MPISINNSLPSVSLILGIREDEENKMRMLVDTGVAMNTGNIDFYMWIMLMNFCNVAKTLSMTLYIC